MYNVSTNFKEYIKKPARTLSSKIVISSSTYTDTDIVDMSLESNLVPVEEFTLGCTICNKFEATIMTSNNIIGLSEIKPYIGLDIGGIVEEVPLGVFTIDNVKVNKNNKKIVTYDNMMKFEKAYFSDLSYPATIQNIATEICQKAGVSFNSALPNYSIDAIGGKTLREAIGIIAGICGGFARINRTGSCEIVGLTSTDSSITPDNFFGSIEKADKDFIIKKITAIKEDNSTINAGAGMPSEEITFSNNFITQAMIDSILTTYNNYSYRPLKFNWQGNPAIDAGDKIAITDIDNTVYAIPVMRLKLTYQGGLKSEISSVAKSDSKSEYDYKGPVSKKIERVIVEQMSIKEALMDKATIEELNSSTAKIVVLEGKIARLDTIEGNIANINTILSKDVFTELANVGKIVAGSSIIANEAIGSAQISSLDVAKLNAGDFSTAKFTILGTNGRLKIVDNRLQVFAGTTSLYERISLGDVNGDGSVYGLRVRGSDGATVLLDENGVTKQGFTDGYNKVDNDSLDPAKIDIVKVVTRINNSTTTIQGSKVYVDGKTLNVSFSTLKTTVTDQGQSISSQAAQISAMDSAIKLRVETQTYNTKMSSLDGSIITINTNLSKATSDISVLQGQIVSKVSQTDIDNAVNGLQGQIDIKANQTDLDGMNEDLSTRINQAETVLQQTIDEVSIKADKTSLDELGNAVEQHTTELSVLNNQFSVEITRVDSALDGVKGDMQGVKSFMHYDGDDFTLGKTDSPMQLSLANEEMSFLDSGQKVMSMSGQKLLISTAEILNSLIVGVHKIEKYDADTTFVRLVG